MHNGAEETAPTPELAAAIAAQVTGRAPKAVARFATGARHYVYEARFADRQPIVVRIGSMTAHAEIAGAVYLSSLLRPRGVPLPAILAEDIQSTFPWMVLERLRGVDLGDVIESFTDADLEEIAERVARAQSITSETGSSGHYGYAVRPEGAPHSTWSQVLDAHLGRSRRRIASAGLFSVASADSRAKQTRHLERRDQFHPAYAISARHHDQERHRDSRRRLFGNCRRGRPLLWRSALSGGPDNGGADCPRRSRPICLGVVTARGTGGRPTFSNVRDALSAGPDVRAWPSVQRQRTSIFARSPRGASVRL